MTTWKCVAVLASLGLMMLGLMTRVSQRHTGRPLSMPRAMQTACAAMFLAAVFRLAAGVGAGNTAMIGLATLLWVAPFVIYLAFYARMLLSPSLPRANEPP